MADTENRDKVSLIDCMQDVPDPRAPYNQKHKFLDIIIIAITAVLSGMDTWNEIEDWAHSKREWLKTFFTNEVKIQVLFRRTINCRCLTRPTGCCPL